MIHSDDPVCLVAFLIFVAVVAYLLYYYGKTKYSDYCPTCKHAEIPIDHDPCFLCEFQQNEEIPSRYINKVSTEVQK